MLEEIRIASLGVIEESVLELGPGFTAITGETGAGKTMVVTALGLLLGGRADTGAVRTGAKAARVEGLVRVPESSPWAAALTDRVDRLGGEVDEGMLVVARQISAEGRSRAFAGGASVPVGALSELIDPLVAVHGQSDQHRLLQALRAARRPRPVRRSEGGQAARGLRGRLPSASRRRKPSWRRWWSPHVSVPARPTCCASGSARSRRSRPSPGRTSPWQPRRPGWASPTRCARRPHRPGSACLPRSPGPTRSVRCRPRGSCSTGCASTTPRRRRWPTGWPRSATCSPTSRPTSRPTPPASTPTPSGSRPSRSGERR